MNQSRVFAVITLIIGLMFSTGVMAQTNLVVNGDFESFDSNKMLPSGWQTTTFSNSNIEYGVDSEIVKTGKYSMKVKGHASSAAPRGARGSVNQFIDIEPGETYRLSAWYRTDNKAGQQTALVRLIFRDASDEFVHIRDDFSFEVFFPSALHHEYEGRHLLFVHAVSEENDDWTHIETFFRAPDKAVRVHLELFLWHQDSTVWWDDVALHRVD